ncbi:MAG: PIN domain-containing protein [Anaerolineae bacterium]|nr:PIN domain-containing protein [Anaerolineae bacterium]MDQ7035330.1 PIN domain-containing protein [Anaerolineae bacterium]
MDGIVDTSVIIDAYRGYTPAINWFTSNRQLLFAITPIVWMEVIEGAPDKKRQRALDGLLARFQIVYLTGDDQKWAMQQLKTFNLSHNVDLTDALIAAPAFRLNLHLYTRNTKHFAPLIPKLVQQPY